METLCASSWYPLYAYARRSGRSEEDSRDLVQGFLAGLVERNVVAAADPERGRFRTFLLTAFRNHITNEWRRETAQKRGGGRPVLSMDGVDPEDRYRLEPSHEETPDRLFLRSWALEVLARTLGRLREEYAGRDKADVFDALKGCLDGSVAVDYDEAAETLGITAGAVRVAVHRLRDRYRRALRDEVGQTLDADESIEDEIRDLLDALL
jgi:RNA polymerase sigma-70 factor (ECF subfamily)